jgi:hypothetical protein
MDDWEHRILTGLRSAKIMLAVLSPYYVASAFCRREYSTYLDHELALTLPGDGITPIYTVTVPGFEDGTAADRMLENLGRRQDVDARPCFRAAVVVRLRPVLGLGLSSVSGITTQTIRSWLVEYDPDFSDA